MSKNYESIRPMRIHLSSWAQETMATPNLPTSQVRTFVKDFEVYYNEEDRHHHHAGHVNFMLKLIEQWRKNFDDPAVALWATIGHDSYRDLNVRTPGRDEEISAKMTYESLDGLIESSRLKNIVGFIGATASHDLILPSSVPKRSTNDFAMFLDADNGCVGAGPNVYNAYKLGVRQEYLDAGITSDQYNSGRLEFLEEYNSRDPLFHSVPGQRRFETQAHINMAQEISELRGQILN
jgi:predicted metal-dependent HD superfamily phosphohydrolase